VSVPTYDNLNHAVTLETYSDSDNNGVLTASELRAKLEAKFDERGQVFQTIGHNVANNGAIGNHLTNNFWYNGRSMASTLSMNGSVLSKRRATARPSVRSGSPATRPSSG
jgi:hypothetical protein